MSWLLAVEAFSLFHEFLSFRRHGVDVHSVWVSVSGVVIGVGSVLSGVVSGVSTHCSHESLPVVVEKNGFLVPFVDGFGNTFHGHDLFNQFRFKGFLLEVD